MVLNITVKTLDSRDYKFDAEDGWTVLQFKEHIQETVCIPSNEQRLIFCGRVMQNDKKLTEYDCNEKVIHLVRRPPPTLNDQNSGTSNIDSEINTTRTNESSRFGDDGTVYWSAMTLGTEGNINDVVRQIMSLQQAIYSRTLGEPAPTRNDSNRVSVEIQRRLTNLRRLTRMALTQIQDVETQIARIHNRGSTIPRRTYHYSVSQTDLSREETQSSGIISGNPDATTNTSTGDSRTIGRSNDATNPSNNESLNRRISLTTDDIPNLSSGMPNISRESTTTHPPSAPTDDDELLDTYRNCFSSNHEISQRLARLSSRYDELLPMYRRGSLQPANNPGSNVSATSQSSREPTISNQNTHDPSGSSQQISSVITREMRILGANIPRLMHTHSHLLHALSDFCIDTSNGRLTIPHQGSGLGRIPSQVGPVGQRSSRRQTGPNQDQYAAQSSIVAEIPIAINTVQATPITSTVTTSRPSLAPQASATIVVTTEPPIGGMHQIPISFSNSFSPADVQMVFSTPQVPPPTQEHSRASSASRQYDTSATNAAQQQHEQQPDRLDQSRRQHETASTQTTSTSTTSSGRVPIGIVPSRFAAPPFDAYLMCCSPFADHWHAPSQPTRQTASAVLPEIRVRSRQQTRASPGSGRIEVQMESPRAQTVIGGPMNQNVGVGLTEVVSNILESLFRPGENQQSPVVGQPTNVGQPQRNDREAPGVQGQVADPILNMIPELAMNAASQILGGVFGLSTSPQQPRSANQSNVASSTGLQNRSQVPVMMDIDIDDDSSTHSDARYHDASENQRPTELASRHFQSSLLTEPSTSRQVHQINGQQQVSRIDGRELSQILQNHPDWLPIIEADIEQMERQMRQGDLSPSHFSDAYLNAIPRKRRRLLAASPDRVLILQPSPSQAITNLLKRAVTNSNVRSDITSLDPMLRAVTEDPELQVAYEEHIKSAVEARLKQDEDYEPEKFENTSKYFGP